MDNRKASDILLKLEEQITQVLKYLQNQDFNMKNIMNRISALENKLGQVPQQTASISVNPQSVISPDLMSVKKPKVSAVVPVDVPKKKAGRPPKESNPFEKPIKKGLVKVTQSLVYPDGGRVLFANVKIFNDEGNEVTSAKTNTAGFWTRDMAPGHYKASIFKANPPIDYKFEFDVNSLEQTQELPTPDLSKE